MKKREKILAAIVLGIAGVFAAVFILQGFFVEPLERIERQTAHTREKIAKINEERRMYFDAEDMLKQVGQKTFGTGLNRAFSRSSEMITHQIERAGLNEMEFTRMPVGPLHHSGAKEIGWSIQGSGEMKKILNLLFLLQTSPYIHRIENVTLSAYDKPGEIKVRFLYLTLVLDPAPNVETAELKQPFTLESPERLAYSPILERDILRPYIKAPPPPAPDPAKQPEETKAPPGPESLRVVSLTDWGGQPEIHILDTARDETLQFEPGDELKDVGEIVAIDYRPLPLPDSAGLLSHSRVILKADGEFWAVERGQTLAQKRKLEPGQWPAQ